MLSLVLTTVGLPIESLAIVAGIDRTLDMVRTSVNVCGDLMVTTIIGKSENELDEKVYNAEKPQTEEAVLETASAFFNFRFYKGR